MQAYSRRGFLAFGLCLALPACSLPRGAARRREVLAGAGGEVPEFTVETVDRAFLERMRDWPAPVEAGHHGWIARRNGAAAPQIAAGDRLDLRIWDSEASSLITSPEEKVAEMPGLLVAPSGTIFVPYVGEIAVAGRTAAVARREIESRMTSIVPSAQVQLSLASGRGNSVDVVSGVAAPGRYPLEDLNTSVLNLISEAGGVPGGLRNPRVRLTRGGRTYMTPLSRLRSDPGQDTLLRGGDLLALEEDERHFIALGAAGREEVIDFDAEDISALKAISMMGGVMDSRADPEGVLILRRYPASELGAGGPRSERVVFTIDLTNADGLFSAGEFQIRNGDVVLATESPTSTFQAIIGLLGGTISVTRQTTNL